MLFRLLVVVLILAAPAISYAQTVPSTVDPGRLGERFRALPEPKSEPDTVKKDIEEEKALKVPDEFKEIKFTLKDLIIKGSTVYTPNSFIHMYKDLINKEISLDEIYKIADKITKIYVDDGYILSKAFPPTQSIKNGIVQINIVEVKIEDLEFSGSIKPTSILKRLGKKITSGPMNIKTLEKYMLLMNDLPGITARAVLKSASGGKVGAGLEIVLQKQENSIDISFDNFGSRFLGPFEGVFNSNINNPLGFYDQISFGASTSLQTDELKYVQLSYRVPVNSEGTSLSFTASASDTAPGDSLEDTDIESINYTFSIGTFHPIIRSRQKNLSISSEFSVKNTNVDTLKVLFYEDKTRVWSLSGTLDFIDRFLGSNLINVTYSKGLDLFGARKTGSINLSRSNGHSNFNKISGIFSRLQAVGKDFSIYTAATGQVANDKLLSSEEFGYGGQQFGRGYNSSEIAGKDGFAVAAELRYGSAPQILGADIQPFLFYDVGMIWNVNGGENSASGASAGFGIRFSKDTLSGSLYAAQPLTRPVNSPVYGNGKNPAILFSLQKKF